MKSIFILFGLISLVSCGGNSVTINVRNVVNKVSDKFISYELELQDLMQRKTFEGLKSASPAYIKIKGFFSHLKNGKSQQFNETDVASMFHSLK